MEVFNALNHSSLTNIQMSLGLRFIQLLQVYFESINLAIFGKKINAVHSTHIVMTKEMNEIRMKIERN